MNDTKADVLSRIARDPGKTEKERTIAYEALKRMGQGPSVAGVSGETPVRFSDNQAADPPDESALAQADELALFGPRKKWDYPSLRLSDAAPADYSVASDDPAPLKLLINFYRQPFSDDRSYDALRQTLSAFGESYGTILFILYINIGIGNTRQHGLDSIRQYANTQSEKYAGIRKVAKAFLENYEAEDSQSYQHGPR